jgi:hypothetical protein
MYSISDNIESSVAHTEIQVKTSVETLKKTVSLQVGLSYISINKLNSIFSPESVAKEYL